MSETHILLVEDDPEIRGPVAKFLQEKGFRVSEAESAEAATALLRQEAVDLILLDVMLPGEDGLSLCRRLRATSDIRIIMLTALSEATDKVIGLEVGADDYLAKPFDLREMLARIRALLRRGAMPGGAPRMEGGEPELRFAGIVFHPQRRFLRTPSGLRIPLTGQETDLLIVFCQNPHQVMSRDELIARTRGDGYAISARSVDLLVSRLRRKLSDDDPMLELIRTVRADGYVFQVDVTA